MIRNILVGLSLSTAVLALASTSAKADVIVNTTCRLNNSEDVLFQDRYFDVYYFDGVAGEPFTTVMSSSDVDTLVRLVDEQGEVIVENDDMDDTSSNSMFSTQLPYTGGYAVVATTYNLQEEGTYHLIASTNRSAAMEAIANEIQYAVPC